MHAGPSRLIDQSQQLPQIGHRITTGCDRVVRAGDLLHPSLDPGAKLLDRRGGFALGGPAGEHDLDTAGRIDGHADASCSFGAADVVRDFHGRTERVRCDADVPAFPELREALSDGVVALRAFAERDIPEILIAYQDDRGLHLSIGEARPPSGAELGRRAERAEAERAAGTHVRLTILERGSDICRGQLSVHGVDWDHARAELGIWLAPQVRGQGVAGKSLRVASGWLLGPCGLERLQVLTEPDNEAMIGAAKAAGFLYEGVLRGYTREHGERVDNTVLARVRADLRD